MEFEDLLKILIQKYKEKRDLPPGKTMLIKLAYLAEVYYKRLTGERLTNVEWVFWHYGPYVMKFDEILRGGPFEVKELEDYDLQPVDLAPQEVGQVLESEKKLSPMESVAITRAMEFADKDLADVLDFVYFDTEPMLEARNRGDVLDFDMVLPEEAYRVKRYKLPENAGKIISDMRREWLAKRAKWRQRA